MPSIPQTASSLADNRLSFKEFKEIKKMMPWAQHEGRRWWAETVPFPVPLKLPRATAGRNLLVLWEVMKERNPLMLCLLLCEAGRPPRKTQTQANSGTVTYSSGSASRGKITVLNVETGVRRLHQRQLRSMNLVDCVWKLQITFEIDGFSLIVRGGHVQGGLTVNGELQLARSRNR